MQRLNLLDKFKKGAVRVLCCTKAFGLGCNIPNIEYSIIYNSVDSMVDLWQKGGRAARGRRVKGRVIWLASLDAFGPSDEWKKKSGDSHSISVSPFFPNPPVVESRSFYYPYHPSIDSQINCGFFTSSSTTISPTPFPSSANPFIAPLTSTPRPYQHPLINCPSVSSI